MSQTGTSRAASSADFDDWREPLLASLRDCDAQRAPRLAALRYMLAVLALGFTVAVAGVGGRLMGEVLRNAPVPVVMMGYGLLFLFIVAVLSRIRNRFLRQAWQASARTAEDELSRLGSRRPILYLRSFALDQKVGRPSWLERYLGTRPFPNAEQQLTVELRKLGPVIAIGRPGEKLPALGAARFYVSHERWQEKVIDILKCAQLVVWATGVTEGLRWEISHLAGNLHPRRFLLWAHPHLLGVSARRRELEWKRFRDTLGTVFPKPLPEKLGDIRFFVFDAEWTPRAVEPTPTAVFTSPQKSALRTALRLQQNGFNDPVANQPRILDSSLSMTDFGALIGARGPKINWSLVVAFVATLLITSLYSDAAMRAVNRYMEIRGPWLPSLTPRALLFLAAQMGAMLIAFRFVRSTPLAVLAAAAGITLLGLLFLGSPFREANPPALVGFTVRVGLPFVKHLAFVGGLTWAVARCSPLFVGLWIGYFLGELVGTSVNRVSGFLQTMNFESSADSLMAGVQFLTHSLSREFPSWLAMPLSEAAVFALVYTAVIKTLPLFVKPGPRVV